LWLGELTGASSDNSLQLFFVAMTYGEVRFWLWKSLEISGQQWRGERYDDTISHTGLLQSKKMRKIYLKDTAKNE